MRLCRRPRTAPGRTPDQDLADIACRFGIDTTALWCIVAEAAP
jgi:hypothetical protein